MMKLKKSFCVIAAASMFLSTVPIKVYADNIETTEMDYWTYYNY